MVGCDQDPGQPAREIGPYLADLDVSHGVATARLGDPDDSRIGLLAALYISIKLGVIERMAEEAGAPFNERCLRSHPGHQSPEVLASERAQGNVRQSRDLLHHSSSTGGRANPS